MLVYRLFCDLSQIAVWRAKRADRESHRGIATAVNSTPFCYRGTPVQSPGINFFGSASSPRRDTYSPVSLRRADLAISRPVRVDGQPLLIGPCKDIDYRRGERCVNRPPPPPGARCRPNRANADHRRGGGDTYIPYPPPPPSLPRRPPSRTASTTPV